MRRYGLIVLCALLLALTPSCEDTTWQSSVPAYPVRIVIDTQTLFVHFLPTAFGSYIVVNQGGYYENDKLVIPLGVMDQYGYGGVVTYVGMSGYEAFDLACPYCAAKGQKNPCVVDGMFAVCPYCGEEYDLASGTAAPQKGVSKEALRRLHIQKDGGKLTVTQ